MARYAVLNGSDVVVNVVVANSQMESNWVSIPDDSEVSVDYTYDEDSGTFSAPTDQSPEQSAAQNKDEAKELLVKSDWTVLADVGLTNANVAEWKTYRASLRAIVKNPSEGRQTWPTEPSVEYS